MTEARWWIAESAPPWFIAVLEQKGETIGRAFLTEFWESVKSGMEAAAAVRQGGADVIVVPPVGKTS